MTQAGRRRGKWLLLALPVLGLALSAGDAESPFPSTDRATFVHTGDLREIEEHGQLRVLFPEDHGNESLLRPGSLLRAELELVREYALRRGLEPVFIRVASRQALIPALLAGAGDVVAANLEPGARRGTRVAYTVPVGMARVQLVARTSDTGLDDAASLAGRRVAVRLGTAPWKRVEALRDAEPAVEIEALPADSDDEEMLDGVASGIHDVAVVESGLAEASLQYRSDLRAAFDLGGRRPIAWAVRPDSGALLDSLNRFLTDRHLTSPVGETSVADLSRIRERRVLRVLTRPGYASYFMWRGRVMGFEHDLANEFARREGLRLEIVVPQDGEDLLDLLRAGRGDIVASAYAPTPGRIAAGGLLFSQPYDWTSEVVVTRADDPPLTDPRDFRGRTIYVHRSSEQWERLERLRASGIEFELEPVPESLPAEEIIARVASGRYDLTVAESHVLDIELSWRSDVRPAFALEEWVPQTWVTRSSNPELLAAVNRFIGDVRGSTFFAVTRKQYFENAARVRSRVRGRAAGAGALSPYDDVVRRYAEQFGFDWRLIVAQMYEESGFDPSARSFAGAMGLMQMLPGTAASLGFSDPEDPEQSIQAGVRYMNLLRDRFEPELPVADRLWFTLAAYNAGFGRVRSARLLAAQRGLDPNRWFNHVEVAMTLLSRPADGGTGDGETDTEPAEDRCRCTQTVAYVREVRDRYKAYLTAL